MGSQFVMTWLEGNSKHYQIYFNNADIRLPVLFLVIHYSFNLQNSVIVFREIRAMAGKLNLVVSGS